MGKSAEQIGKEQQAMDRVTYWMRRVITAKKESTKISHQKKYEKAQKEYSKIRGITN